MSEIYADIGTTAPIDVYWAFCESWVWIGINTARKGGLL